MIPSMKFAIIDVGSNSVRLMLWADGKTLYKKIITTRLGENLAESNVLSESAIERTLAAIQTFCKEAKTEDARIFAFATAAVRSAKNRAEFCKRVKENCKIELDVVSGSEEAQLGIFGALGNADGGIIDIGGASTELCFRKGGATVFSESIDIGAVLLFDLCKDDKRKLTEKIKQKLFLIDGINLAGNICAIGGTASTLASIKLGLKKYDPNKLQHVRLTVRWVEETAERLLSMTVSERKQISGMDPSRADVIAGAAYLLSEIMKTICCESVAFSDRDNLEGYLAVRGLV